MADDADYLRVRRHVWDAFGQALDVPGVELDAVVDVHEERTRRDVGTKLDGDERFVVLDRT